MNQKREQIFAENKLKRQKIFVDTPPFSQSRPKPAHKTPATVVQYAVQDLPTADVMSNIAGVNTQDVGVSEATTSGVAAAIGVLCASAAPAQAAVRSDSETLGTVPPMANPGAGQAWYTVCKKDNGSPHSITERRVPELILVLGSQPAGVGNHKPAAHLLIRSML